MKVAVLGGGITGMVMTRSLVEQGHEVRCLEAAPHTGGLCASETVDGFVVDKAGGHIIFSKDKEVLSYVLDALEPVGHHTSNRRTFILQDGHHIPFPYENGIGDLPPEMRFEALRDYLEAACRRRNGAPCPDDFHNWCLWRFGEGMCRQFMHPYNRKIWNVDLRELGVEWVAGRVPDAPVDDVLRSALGMRTQGYRHQAVFHYPLEGGFGAIVEGVKAHIPAGVVHTGAPCRSLERRAGGWLVNDEPYDRVVSTIPLPELGKVLKDVPGDVARAFERLDWVSLLTVFLALDRPEVPAHSWIYFPHTSQGPQNRITYLSNYSPRNAPEGKTSVMAEVTYHRELPASEDRVVQDVVDGLVSCGVIKRGQVMWTRTYRNKYAYILYRKDLERNLEAVRKHCATVGLDIVGRFGNYSYFNSDACIRAALDLAATYADRV